MSFNQVKGRNKDISTKASYFCKLLSSFDCIVTLVLTRSILDLTLPVNESIPGKKIDVSDAS